MNQTSALIQSLLKAGWTQTAIAARTGIPQPRLSRWAAGQAPVGADDALKLQSLSKESAAKPGHLPAGEAASTTAASQG